MKRSVSALLLVLALVGCKAQVKEYKLKVVKEYDHDVSSYTQGLFFHDGQMYESTGQWGESTMRIVDLQTGNALRKLEFGAKYFVEGSSILGDNLYILTWTNRLAFVYDAKTLEYKQSYSYPREGWGLTTDGKSLIASDGSANLYFLDGKFQLQKSVVVKMDGKAVTNLNELEYIDGKVWANVYLTDLILIINPETGNVEGRINCEGLLPNNLRNSNTDVLNGIAYNPGTGKIYITGKYWPRLYEITLD